MKYRRLFIFIEGVSDARFVERVIKPMLKEKYDLVDLVKYANQKKKKINGYLKTIRGRHSDYVCYDYFCLTDINRAKSEEVKKQEIQNRFCELIDKDRIIVVIKEIESWYLAGLDDKNSKELGIRRSFDTTDNITKEQFKNLIPKSRKFDRIPFMLEILNYFSVEVAKKKNRSFRCFLEKLLG